MMYSSEKNAIRIPAKRDSEKLNKMVNSTIYGISLWNYNFAMITFRYLILAAQCHMQVLGHFVLYYCIFNQDMCGHIRTSMYGIIIMIS